jgi:hypothetical protein
MTSVLPFAASALLACLGAVHFVYAAHDFGLRPRYFCPSDNAALEALRTTSTRIAPRGRDYWSGVLGFHLSHSIGVLLFALLVGLATSYGISWLKPLLVIIGGIYTFISVRCWFQIPTIGISIATMMMAVGWYTG